MESHVSFQAVYFSGISLLSCQISPDGGKNYVLCYSLLLAHVKWQSSLAILIQFLNGRTLHPEFLS